jgi:hypothetical protein
MSVFKFAAPSWVNTAPVDDAEDSLRRAWDAARAYYPLGTQTGVHAMIEWCGVMSEYVNMLEYGYKRCGIDPRDVDQHGPARVAVPSYMVAYLCEKLGCQLKPFIRADAALWRREIDKWFKEGA